MNTFSGRTWYSVIGVSIAVLSTFSASWSQFLTSPQPGDIYKEFTRTMSVSGRDWRVTDPNATYVGLPGNSPSDFLPNPQLPLNIDDLQEAVRAEAVIDIWGGHVGTTGKRFRFNGNSWIDIPELATTPTSGPSYTQQFNVVVTVPLNHLVQGTNILEGTSGGQISYDFGWGQWGWYMLTVRVYYNQNKPHPTGSITSPSAGGTIGENPTIAATTQGTVSRVEFLALYDGYDTDGDGRFLDYHQSYHRGPDDTQMNIRWHAGTDASAPYSVVWNTGLVADQSTNSISLVARILGTDGTWFVTNAVNNISLQRTTTSVKLYKPQNVPENYWVRDGSTKSSRVTIPSTDSLFRARSSILLVRTWNGISGGEEAGESHFTRVNSWNAPLYGENHFYSFDTLSVPTSQLLSGANTVTFFSSTIHHGIEILWPGPALLVRYDAGPLVNVPPFIITEPISQSIVVGQPVSFSVSATGSQPLAYQWQRNGSNITSASSPSFSIAATVQSDSGSAFRCIVSNSFGRDTSATALLTITGPLVSVLQNSGFETGTTGWSFFSNGSATFAADVPGPVSAAAGHISISQEGTNVQLYQAGISLKANTLYTLNFKAYSNSGHDFSVTLQKHDTPFNPYGLDARVFDLTTSWNTFSVQFTTAGFSGTVTDGRLRIWLAPYDAAGDQYFIDDIVLAESAPSSQPVIVTQPANQTAGVGQTATFSVVAGGTAPLAYQWQKNTVTIAGATSSSYTTPAVTVADNGSTYRCVVTNAVGSITSASATLTVSGTLPVITVEPLPLNLLLGQTATFSVTATGTPPLSYQWQKNTVTIAGAVQASYTTPSLTLADSGAAFRCIVSNTFGSDTSASALVRVFQPISITSHPANQTVVAGQSAVFSVLATGSAPLSYQWQRNNAAIAGATSPS